MNLGRALALGLFLSTLTASVAAGAEAKRVLMVHSFGSTAPPFTTHSTAFETALTEAMGKRVDLDEVSLDMARYAQPDMEGAFVELLGKRLEKWRPDLVVPIGSPAGRFVARNRHRLFPETPVIYTGMDKRTLPPEAFRANATFVGEDFDLAGLVEDILQMKPDTNHVAVVLGATPLERYWAIEFRRAFERFAGRVRFTWTNDLTFDEMLDRAAKMPPRSFILLGLLLRDAAGVTHNEDDALQRLRAVAGAPINGLWENQLGLGIVGGRLYQAEAEGVESARIAVRILGGEPASSFPPLIIGTQRARYDWRELQRWNIDERRLPPGSEIAFRRPTTWERYRGWILGALAVGLLQAGLIGLLAVNLVRRRRVERQVRESEARFRTVADSAPVLIWMADADQRRTFFNKPWLDFAGRTEEQELGDGWTHGVHGDDRDVCLAAYAAASDARKAFILQYRLRRSDGEYRWISDHGVPRYDARGGFAGYIGSCSDVTDRLRAEAETEGLRQELAHIARVSIMGELTAAIVHEVSQPLTVIRSNAQVGLRLLAAGDPDLKEMAEILEDVVAADHRADQVIQRLRSLFRKGETEHRPLALNNLVNDVIGVVASDAARRDVAIAPDLASGLPLVSGDRVQLQQVLLNLVVNAFDAMAGDADRPRRLLLRTRAAGADQVQVDVADTGAGVAPDALASIFKPFVTTKRDGMGMGLSVSHSIVRAHGGRLWAENGPEGGAIFHVALPARSAAGEA